MPGVKIGDGAMIATRSVVTKDIPAYTAIGDNPVKIIKKHFDDELIELLLELKWWDFEPYKLVDILPLLCNPDLELVKTRIRDILHIK